MFQNQVMEVQMFASAQESVTATGIALLPSTTRILDKMYEIIVFKH